MRKLKRKRDLYDCLELVLRRECEYTLIALLAMPVGEWVNLYVLCEANGVDIGPLTGEEFVCWTRSPSEAVDGFDSGYVAIVFHDNKTFGTICAIYNRHRLEDSVLEIDDA